jgi:hypothetical protein
MLAPLVGDLTVCKDWQSFSDTYMWHFLFVIMANAIQQSARPQTHVSRDLHLTLQRWKLSYRKHVKHTW